MAGRRCRAHSAVDHQLGSEIPLQPGRGAFDECHNHRKWRSDHDHLVDFVAGRQHFLLKLAARLGARRWRLSALRFEHAHIGWLDHVSVELRRSPRADISCHDLCDSAATTATTVTTSAAPGFTSAARYEWIVSAATASFWRTFAPSAAAAATNRYLRSGDDVSSAATSTTGRDC